MYNFVTKLFIQIGIRVLKSINSEISFVHKIYAKLCTLT